MFFFRSFLLLTPSNLAGSILAGSILTTSITIGSVMAGLWTIPNSAIASVPPSEVKLPQSLPEPKPVDLLQQEISKAHASKTARILKQAYEAFQNKKYTEAIQLANRVKNDPTYSDYGYWILASAGQNKATHWLEEKKYSLAIAEAKKAKEYYLKIYGDYPYSPFIRDISKNLEKLDLLLGDIYWKNKKWTKSQNMFESAFQRLHNQNGLLLVGVDHLSHYVDTCKKSMGPFCEGWLRKFTTQFPKKSDEVAAILKGFPAMAIKTNPYRLAGKLTTLYRAPDLDQAAFGEAMQQYLSGQYNDAIKSFKKFLDDFPRSNYSYRARYWLAQALSLKHNPDEARKLYEDLTHDTPLSYYGLLAAKAIEKPLDALLDGSSTPLAMDTDQSLQPQELLHLKRAQNLIAEKVYDLAIFELREIKIREGLSGPFGVYLALLNYEARNYKYGFQVLGDLIQRGYTKIYSSYFLRMIFPVSYLDFVNKYAIENDLDPILVLSLIKQESAFDGEANSIAGAMGLMQLMPATAIETDPQVSTANLLDPEQNIRVGTKYLKNLMTRFQGNIVYALASYNAGPNATDRWIRDAPKNTGVLEFIESIPYKETREYVASIIRNYFWYSYALNGSIPKTFDYFWNFSPDSLRPTLTPIKSPSLKIPSSIKTSPKTQSIN